MTNPMIEAAARALWEAQCDHWGKYRSSIPDLCAWDDLSQSKQRELIREVTAIEPMIRADERAQVEREIVEWLREQDGHGYDDMRANLIEAGEHRRHNPNCAVVRNGNLRAWCDCGKGDG